MRALTLTQPWAGLVASGIKLIENRPRSMIKREDFGVPFAIHASREIDEGVYKQIADIAPELPGRTPAEWGCRWFGLSRITSAIIAVATIERAVYTGSPRDVLDLHATSRKVVDLGDQARWFFGRVGYVLRDVRALATPVPCRGWQGFWRVPDVTEQLVLDQLEGGNAPSKENHDG